ncbi:hypothetical protein D9758_002453 [Tetrapyrgos nigripes]|uniref:Uncharacterized protein n=1 Tax=Tetrapyrgos nigripes TaxID=182062 RepID=A0A8H5GPR2_9AGAR|nr:hypothetical protein D9758_002453 [Tetrapyrgos nigripes]
MSRANSLDLPGLSAPGIIPILAKVEFDIDKKKAGWYVPWMRSRTLNHAKRMRSRQTSGDDTSESGDGSDRKPPVMLKLRAQTASPVSLVSSSADSTHPADELNAEYARLQDEQASEEDEEVKDEEYARLQDEQASEEDEEVKDEDEDEEGEEVEVEDEEGSNDDDDDETARVASTGKDPLVDVFGSDADTWADMREISGAKRKSKDPNVVELALTGGDLANLEESDHEDNEGEMLEGGDVEEVKGIMERMSLESSSGKNQRSHVPTPLTLHTPSPAGTELVIPNSNSGSRASTYLPYLEKSPTEDEDDPKSHRSPTESGKRVGGVFDDLDLGLEPSLSEDVDLDFDGLEIPNDHRQSQYILKAQLDEIERNLNQLSPRALKIDITDEQENVVSLPFLVPAKTNADVFPPTPKNGSFDIPSDGPPKQWPAVPYSQLNEEVMPGSAPTSSIPSPPRLAVNGVTTSAPKAFVANLNDDISSETQQRRKALEDELHHYPTVGLKRGETTDSPIIPLSPDPFGRYPSTPEPSTSRSGSRQSGPVGPREPHVPSVKDADSKGSRFSIDSVSQEVEDKKTNNRTTILSTKGIRRLWRRSNNKSLSNISVHSEDKVVPTPPLSSKSKTSMDSLNPPTPGLSSGRSSPTPSRPPRPSEEDMDIPDIPPQMAIPLHPDSGRPAPMPIIAAQMQRERSRSALDNLHFDQESPYPMTRRSPAPPPPTPKEPFVPGDASRTSVRKSILKWKAGTSAGSGGKSSVDLRNDSTNGGATPVTRPERTTSSAPRPRRPSLLSFGSSSRLSQTSPPPSIPPSPRIPEQYLNQQNTNGAHLRSGSSATHLTTSSIETRVDSLTSSTARTQSSRTTVRSPSPSHSMASGKSRTSEEGSDARPSIDESQFEIVSPPMGVSQQLSYPYHDLDAPA